MLPLRALCALLAAARVGAWLKGVVFGGDEWTPAGTSFGSAPSAASLAALAATGADTVRLIFTGYQTYENSTDIFSIAPPSPLASASLADVRAAARAAAALNLSVFLAPILDPSWDVVSNWRASSGAPAGARPVSRLAIGAGFTDAQWDAWFAAYSAWLLPAAQLAADEGAALFEVASELDVAFAAQGARWRAVIAAVRRVYAGPLVFAANAGSLANISFFDAVDYIGVDAYYGLGEALDLGVVPAVDALVAAWQPIVAELAALAAAHGKPVLITEVGYQSRPSCHVRPWGTVVHDPLDDSAWLEDHDPACQANAYEALLRAFTPQPWFAGVFWWLWRGDPTAGGTGCSDFTPHGKPAEAVLRRWYGGGAAGGACAGGGAYGADFLAERPAAPPPPQWWWSPARGMTQTFVPRLDAGGAACDGSSAVVAAVGEVAAAAAAAAAAPRRPGAATGARRLYNGYVFGGPDQWSSPSYRYDSEGAAASLAAMAASGADTAEIIVQWYVDDANSTEIYPITDTASALRTSTDDELRAIIAAARALNLTTMLTLMLDPNWLLPAQNWCRGGTDKLPGCHWRGEIGEAWGTECGAGSPWAAFFAGYTAAVVHYARLAAGAGVDAYLLSHELQTAVTNCPELWASQLAAVRAVYSGKVSTAFNPDGASILPPALSAQAWVQQLDFIGVDCYQALPLPPFNGSGGLSPADVHPPLPWQDLALDELLAATAVTLPAFAALSAATGGKKIVCTEVGWASRPWTYAYRAGTPRLDGEDCSVVDQCASSRAQGLAYSAFLQAFYAQEWFGGVTFWTWRADPTSGGASDDGFVPSGKDAAAAAGAFWRQ